MNKVLINLKPSHRIVNKFKSTFNSASFYGSTVLGGKGKSYLISIDEFESKKELIKMFGSKSKSQPFIS